MTEHQDVSAPTPDQVALAQANRYISVLESKLMAEQTKVLELEAKVRALHHVFHNIDVKLYDLRTSIKDSLASYLDPETIKRQARNPSN